MMEIIVGVGIQNGTDCYEVKSVDIIPYEIKSKIANTIIDGKAFNKLEDLEYHVKQLVNNILLNIVINFSDENI